MDKTPEIAEEQLVMTIDKAQETKLQKYKVSITMFSADISKSKEISRWRPINKALHCDFFIYQDDYHKWLKTAHLEVSISKAVSKKY